MRVLLDECVPRKLRRELSGHDVRTVAEMGWSGMQNGPLLRRAARGFDVFLTVDQGIEYELNLAGTDLAVIVMVARSNDIDALRPLVPQVRDALARTAHGRLVRVQS